MRCLAILVAVLTAPSIAHANMGPPRWGGEPAGEPAGITDIAITHEELVIDLQPVAEPDRLVHVTATYHLDNRAAPTHLDLVFPTGAATRGGLAIALDGHAVSSARIADARLPASWQAPSSTPAIDDRAPTYEPIAAEPFGFELEVSGGRHEVVVTYVAEAASYRDEPVIGHQFAYVLSPARSWGSFGGLDVTVRVPRGWIAAMIPALARDGDTFHGAFATIPADALAITVATSRRLYGIVRVVLIVLAGIVVVGGGQLATTRLRAMAVWPLASAAAALAAINLPAAITLPDLEVARGFGPAVASMFVVIAAVLLIPVGYVIARVRAHATH